MKFFGETLMNMPDLDLYDPLSWTVECLDQEADWQGYTQPCDKCLVVAACQRKWSWKSTCPERLDVLKKCLKDGLELC